MTDHGTERSPLAARVLAMAEDIKAAAKGRPPAPVVLAHARRGFVIGGVVSNVLDDYAVVRRDNYPVCDDFCRRTAKMLHDVLGPHLIRRYNTGTTDAEIFQLADVGEAELRESTVEDIDHIAGALITLGATLLDITGPLADRPELPPAIRGAARVAADSAKILWSHYGGDSGGW
ncbi:hypothetical protein [Actinoallomurus sp. NPDC052274]|uniref:hypothetical protein n=1 Tax=Actinoallomurus sp. NPDC052274 TaxID=3155420 RepID=UPI00343AB55B